MWSFSERKHLLEQRKKGHSQNDVPPWLDHWLYAEQVVEDSFCSGLETPMHLFSSYFQQSGPSTSNCDFQGQSWCLHLNPVLLFVLHDSAQVASLQGAILNRHGQVRWSPDAPTVLSFHILPFLYSNDLITCLTSLHGLPRWLTQW